ncbi:MAG: ATP-NAD kinase [Gammaproteobacteria bacterium]|nr:MAG: ATP-NAD kinase [Gammaproteobacteria bacterium]
MATRLKIGLIINPIAGLGGRVALQGSDGEDIQQQALLLGAKPEAENRAHQTLKRLVHFRDSIDFLSIKGAMGSELLSLLGFSQQVCFTPKDPQHTSEEDTLAAASIFKQQKVDLILFAGGDGTARNILQAVGEEQLCLGIPAGCKIYSGVFTVTPENAGELIEQLLKGSLVEMQPSQVLDINEQSYREGGLSTRVFGEMLVPKNGGYVQAVKIAGVESEELVQQDIAAWVIENLDPDTLYLIGSGSSCKVIKDELGIDGSLLGVDVVQDGQCLLKDATEQQLLDMMMQWSDKSIKLIITIIGGQGILLGRGNHQVCHQVIAQLGKENLIVIASKGKIKALQGKPLGVDTGDQDLNEKLSGFIAVITGYDDTIIYPLGV